MGYIDIHAHVVSKVDDGSKSNRESVEMLRQAYQEGITTVIATPHYAKGFGDYKPEDIRKYCRALEKYAKEHISPEISVYPGQEIYYSENALEMIRKGEVLPLAGGRYILLEFDPEISYSEMYRALREIAMTAYYPVVAHVERYKCLRDMDSLEEIHELGVMLQMNYASVSGRWYDKHVRWCRRALLEGLIDVMGTDMHNASDKGPRASSTIAWMEKHLDEEYLEQITSLNARAMIGKRKKKVVSAAEEKEAVNTEEAAVPEKEAVNTEASAVSGKAAEDTKEKDTETNAEKKEDSVRKQEDEQQT